MACIPSSGMSCYISMCPCPGWDSIWACRQGISGWSRYRHVHAVGIPGMARYPVIPGMPIVILPGCLPNTALRRPPLHGSAVVYTGCVLLALHIPSCCCAWHHTCCVPYSSRAYTVYTAVALAALAAVLLCHDVTSSVVLQRISRISKGSVSS